MGLSSYMGHIPRLLVSLLFAVGLMATAASCNRGARELAQVCSSGIEHFLGISDLSAARTSWLASLQELDPSRHARNLINALGLVEVRVSDFCLLIRAAGRDMGVDPPEVCDTFCAMLEP